MSFMLPSPRRKKLRELMRAAVEQWDATAREPVPEDMLKLVRDLK